MGLCPFFYFYKYKFKGLIKTANFIIGIISLTIGVVVLANVFITTVKGVNTTYTCGGMNGSVYNASLTCTWTGAEIALWGLLVIAGIAGIIYGVLNTFGLA